MDRTSNSVGSDQNSRTPSDLLQNYDRLLAAYIYALKKEPMNPYQSVPVLFANFRSSKLFRERVIEMTRRLNLIPNVLKMDFVGTGSIFHELENLDDQTLRGVAECSQINRRRMLRLSLMGVPQIATYGAVVFGVAKAAI